MRRLSQELAEPDHTIDGLRILARLIAREILRRRAKKDKTPGPKELKTNHEDTS